MGWIAFWVAFTICTLAVTVSGYFVRRDAEATLRRAIEKGTITDAATLARLRHPTGLPWAQRLVVLGVIILFAGAGAVVFACLLGAAEPESLMPLLGIAAFVLFLGAGLLAAGAWLRRDSATRG